MLILKASNAKTAKFVLLLRKKGGPEGATLSIKMIYLVSANKILLSFSSQLFIACEW